MSGLRFKVGELAIIAVDLCGEGREGWIVQIRSVGPHWSHGWEKWFDYETTDPTIDHEYLLADDIELRKIDPPTEPATLTRSEECGVEA